MIPLLRDGVRHLADGVPIRGFEHKFFAKLYGFLAQLCVIAKKLLHRVSQSR